MIDSKEIFKFSLTGVFVVGTDMGVYYLLISILPFFLAKAVSFSCGGVVAYLLNKYWTFKQAKKSAQEIGRFVIANTSALVFNVLVNESILKINPQAVFVALVVATAGTAVFTFLTFKFWVFRPHE